MAEEQVVKFEVRGHTAIFTLDRPEAMNAMTRAMSLQMQAHLERFEADDDLWVGIVASAHPKVFAAGADLKAVAKKEAIFDKKYGAYHFVNFPRTKPVIAAVDGTCIAGGMELAISCDMIVASTNAKFGVPEVRRSLIPAAGGLFRLPRKLPHHVAMEVVLTGDPIDAARAHQLGFVNVLAEPGLESTLNAALGLAERICVNAPLAVREAKACIDEMTTRGMDQADFDRSNQGLIKLFKTPDYKEGPKAFIEKRAPRWTGKRSAL